MFRPCIDLREGRVTQIVGGTLTASVDGSDHAQVNFESHLPAAHYASLYQQRGLRGGHVIMLGPGNEQAALEALAAYPNGLQVGGGITIDNAQKYLAAGASHVIVTSFVFRDGMVDMERLRALVELIGKDRLVLDLSCRKRLVGEYVEYVVVTDRWQKMTSLVVSAAVLDELSQFCTEFLVHGVDVEGKRCGIEAPLVQLLGECSPIPVTYAGGVEVPRLFLFL
jgi:phosphoribosylformimino-5-aminoimidazole carboxamide ribotide isomerase